MLKVAAFTGGKNASPARFRVRQYIEFLKAYNISMTEFAAPLSSWPTGNRWLRPAWGGATLATRLPAVCASHFYDVTLLQQSLVSTYVTLEGLTARPRILDVDDAIWAHAERGGFAKRLAGLCDSIICGNNFLAEQFSKWNRNVVVIPTGVDTDRFTPVSRPSSDRCVIGWSGGSAGFNYLYEIETALSKVLENNPQAMLSIVTDRQPDFTMLPMEQVIITPWTPENEVQTIQEMDIGLMPIENSVGGWGKCSYKMLLYMACGKPVVVSPYGMNQEVLSGAEVGLGARSSEDWVDSITSLISNVSLRREMGMNGRKVVLDQYSKIISGRKIVSHVTQYK